MTLTLEIDADTAADLAAETARRQVSVEAVAADILRAFAARLNRSDDFVVRKVEEKALEERQ